MKDVARLIGKVTFLMAVAVVLFPVPSRADNGQKYCVTPPFINASIPPNVLLMIDNSSSMYDLAYADDGNKDSAGTITRQPYYCYDKTYKSQVCSNNSLQSCTMANVATQCGAGATCVANTYAGYFDPNTFYQYDFTNKYFIVPASAPNTSDAAACPYAIGSTLCVKFNTAVTPNTVSTFAASGNYLNWLTTSKFDVEKKVLTGGKYITKVCDDPTAKVCSADTDCATGHSCITVTSLQDESRGCVGQGFIKDALTTDFVNFPADGTDTNTKLGVVFAVRGPIDSANPSAPSRGGQTFIEIYRGIYNEANCQAAMQLWSDPTATQNQVGDAVALCLNYNSSNTPNYCSGQPSITCTIDANCVFAGNPAVSGGCSNNGSIPCTADSTCGTRTVPGTCSNIAGHPCTNATADCTVTTGGTCSNQALPCTQSSQCTIAGYNGTCSNISGKSCTTPTVSADCFKAETMGTCSTGVGRTCRSSADCPAIQGYCSVKHGNSFDACTTTANCGNLQHDGTYQYGTCSNPVNVAAGTCSGYVASSTGTCSGYLADNTGTCSGGSSTTGTCNGVSTAQNTCTNPVPVPSTTLNYGPCVNPTQSAVVKTKVSYQHTIQTCWSYFNAKAQHPTWTSTQLFSNGDFTRLTSSCDEVFAGWGICHDDNTKTCSTNADCTGLGVCVHGPDSIRPGNPALVCSTTYVGQFCTWGASGPCSWNAESVTTDDVFAQFCNAQQPTVIDPTDSAASTVNYEQTPALLSGIGTEAQLGQPLGTIPVRKKMGACAASSDCAAGFACVNSVCNPTGLIQEFSAKIRLGAMTFNFNGSATEASSLSGATIVTPKVCSNDTTRLCLIPEDCNGAACSTATNNLDGGFVNYPVGRGHCSTSPLTQCTTDANCTGANNVCLIDGVGDHVTSDTLINKLDIIRANAWTPFAEAYYNAIGYFAKDPVTGNSRTTLRINSSPPDFDETLNPSQYRCQRNYVLLVSDGSSTADRNPNVSTVAGLYNRMAGKPAGWDSTCPNYVGSKNLPIMSWIAYNRNIATFSLSGTPTATVCSNNASVVCSADSTCGTGNTCLNIPRNMRDTIGTHVVFNGASNGLTGECNSLQLLTDTATNGGSTIQQASDPSQLSTVMRTVFEQLSAKASSGTAASILSNSEGSGANILQAVFYPKKTFDNGATDVNWVGELQNLWYYIDPFIGHSSVREDTDYTATNLAANADHHLNLRTDKVVQFNFNTTTLETEAKLYPDLDGDGAADAVTPTTVSADAVNSLWRAGRLLWARSASDRTIYTNTTAYDPAGNASSTPALLTGLDTSDATGLANRTLLNAASQAEANNIINYTAGVDYTGYRNRTIATTSGGPQHVWKLGDIISSTPRVESSVPLNNYHQPPTGGYNDTTYAAYIATTGYKGRGMAYVAANDGMLHAFRMGSLDVTASGDLKATLSGTDLGKEEWAFIPKNVLPYLKYSADVDYPHIYTMDGATALLDASIACANSDYTNCTKAASSWRTLLIGGMGIGGATRSKDDTCSEDALTAGGTCVKTPVSGVGYSSYYALDVTTPASPSLLWEFSGDFTVVGSPKYLGYATSGPATVKISAKTNDPVTGIPTPDNTKNGHWFAVFASGPTGPIDGCNFRGTSNQNLYLFVVDLKTGALVRTIDTGITDAFAGTIGSGTIDTDRWNKTGSGFYQDNAVYVGYTKRRGSGTAADPYTWTDGGVLRLLTKESRNPNNWTVYPLIDGIGPVTTSVAKLQDRKNHTLWLYFGTGRYFCSLDDMTTSDPPRRLFGVKDPCYQRETSPGVVPYPETLDKDCTDTLGTGVGSLTDKTSDPSDSLSISGSHGWYKSLEAANYPLNGFGAERMISDPVAMTNGVIFMTSFKPTADICEFGGKSYMWATKYDTGGLPMCSSIEGKALVQVSTGAFIEVSLKDVIGCRNPDGTVHPPVTPPPAWADPDPPGYTRPPGKGPGMIGKPPQEPPPIITKSNLKPIKKVLHIRER